ncbi:MAG: hypothetical protein EP329_01675 [Deltaproteobacteria bacterium]|nr:MAG: hypothetical protein EP329_01675 [Deltaproteobacteria bacterium]
MRRMLWMGMLVCGLVLVACGKQTSDPAAASTAAPATVEAPTADAAVVAEPADTAQAAAEPADTAPAPPETEEDKVAQCGRILQKSWQAMAPAYAKVGVEVTADLEKQYLETGYETRKFLEKCPTVSKAYRDCMEAAAHPIENADPCRQRVAESEPQLGRPFIPGPAIDGRTPPSALTHLFARPPLDAAASAAFTAKLPGTWVNEGPFGTTTWTIAAGGHVTEVVTRDGKAGEPKTFDIVPATDTTLTIRYASNDQTRAFHWLSDTALLCEGNLMWTPSYIGDGTRFTALMDFDAVFVDGAACEVVTRYGSLLPATCGFADRDGARYFDVSYQVPGKVRWRTTEPEPTKGSFLVSGEYLVPQKLLDKRFVKP